MAAEIAAAGLSVAGQLVGNYLNRAENQSTRQYNRDLARLQNQYAVQQWNRENVYNHPINQRRRLEAAGFNPNLAFSNGLDNTAAMSPQMTAGAPGTPAPVGFGLGSTAELALLNAQKENIQADTQKKQAETEGQTLQNQLMENINPKIAEQYDISNEAAKAMVEVNQANAALLKESERGQKLLNDENQMVLEIKQMHRDEFERSMVEGFSAYNKLALAQGRQAIAHAVQVEIMNKAWREIQKDPVQWAKVINGTADGVAVNTEEYARLMGINVKEGNNIAGSAKGTFWEYAIGAGYAVGSAMKTIGGFVKSLKPW